MQANPASDKSAGENLTLKAYEKTVKEDVASIQNNLYEMLKLLKIDDDKNIRVRVDRWNSFCAKQFSTARLLKTNEEQGLSKMSQADMDSFEIEIRTSNIVKAAESLSKVVSDLKDLTILNDFKSINTQITSQCAFLKVKEHEIDRTLLMTRDVLAKVLIDLQHEYCMSNYKWSTDSNQHKSSNLRNSLLIFNAFF